MNGCLDLLLFHSKFRGKAVMINKPYLQLRDRLSQVWFNKYTVLSVLIALKLLLFHQSLDNAIKTTQEFTLDSCPSIDSFASSAISLPHYLSQSANYMLLKTVDGINDTTRETLKLILTGSSQLIIFAIEMVIGTSACVLVSAVDGAVDVAVNSTEVIIGWVNNTVGDIADDINDGLTDISNIINKISSTANDIKDFFAGNDDNSAESGVKKVNLTISALRNLQIPSSINDKLEELKDNTPDFETVKNKTTNLIKAPFDLVKAKLENATLLSNDGNDLYVPPLAQSTICSGNTDKINDFYKHLSKDISIAVKIMAALLILAAILAMVPLGYQEYRRWIRLQRLQQLEKEEVLDVIDSYERVFNKYPTMLGLWLSSFSQVPETQNRIRWVVSYSLSTSSLIILGISLAGILAAVSQFIILAILKKSISGNKADFSEIGNELSKQLNESITTWTASTNDYLSGRETSINDELFSVVKETTNSVNNTIAEFVNDMNQVIADAFNGTILYNPVKSIVGCIIEDKLIKIEKGLTWVYDNAEIKLPRVNETYITQAMDSSSNSTLNSTNSQMISKASDMLKSSETMMTSMLKTTVKKYRDTTLFELYISLTLLGVWFIQGVMALLVASWDTKYHEENSVNISYPQELSSDERLKYGYPFTTPNTAFPLRGLKHSDTTLDNKGDLFGDHEKSGYSPNTCNSYSQKERSNPFLSGIPDSVPNMRMRGRTSASDNPFDDTNNLTDDPFGDGKFDGVEMATADWQYKRDLMGS